VIDVSAVTDLKTVQAEDTTMVVTYGATTIDLKVGELADDSVTEDKIADDAVTEDKIADDAVTTAKIAAGAVTGAKISDAANIVHNDIIGGDVTKTAATTLSITACRCWDSTRLVLLETTEAKTITAPTGSSWAANTTYHIYQVRVISGLTIEFRAYATEGGAAADATINAYRWRAFWRTDGSGNLVPGKCVKNLLAFATPFIPVGSALVLSTSGETGASGTVETDIASYVPTAKLLEVFCGALINSSSGSASASAAVKGGLIPDMLYEDTKIVLSGGIGWYSSLNATAYLKGFSLIL
jgi:hypothetical protein